MAGDEDKKKKKKAGKKAEKVEEAPPSAPEPEPEPAPAPPPPEPEPAPPATEGDDWLSAATEEPAPQEVAPEGEAPPEQAPAVGEAPPPEEVAELPPAPKKKPKFFVHWNRRKARFYDYNFDYGENYYSSMVSYMNTKANAAGSSVEVPRRMAFAERGMYSSLARKNRPDDRTNTLLSDVRSSLRALETSQRSYMWEHTKRVA